MPKEEQAVEMAIRKKIWHFLLQDHDILSQQAKQIIDDQANH